MEGLRELSTEVTISAEFLDRPEAPELCEVTRDANWGLVTNGVTTGLKETVWGAVYVTLVTCWGLLTTWLTDDPPEPLASAAVIAPCSIVMTLMTW